MLGWVGLGWALVQTYQLLSSERPMPSSTSSQSSPSLTLFISSVTQPFSSGPVVDRSSSVEAWPDGRHLRDPASTIRCSRGSAAAALATNCSSSAMVMSFNAVDVQRATGATSVVRALQWAL